MILEYFFSKANSFQIDSLNMVLSEIEGDIFFGFTTNGEIHLLVAIFDFLSRFYLFDHNIFVQYVGGWFGHTLLLQIDSNLHDSPNSRTCLILRGWNDAIQIA